MDHLTKINSSVRTFDLYLPPSIDTSRKFYACIPKGASTLRQCMMFQEKEQALTAAQHFVEEDDTATVYVMECVAKVETEKKPVVVKEF